MINSLPLYKHPTTTLIIDDDKLFLNTLAEGLAGENLIKIIDKPKEALIFLIENQNKNIASEKFLRLLDKEENNEVRFAFDCSKILLELNNPYKNNIITAVIVDYDMPELDGLTLCKTLGNKVFKILLTDNVNDSEIIASFNNNIIDAYVPKHSDSLVGDLRELLNKAEDLYFFNISSPSIKTLILNQINPCYLQNAIYIKFFKEYLLENFIQEYYLIEPIGSYLLKSRDGILYKFFLYDEDEFESTIECLPENVNSQLITDLKSRKVMVCDYHAKEDIGVDISQYIFKSHKIPSSGLYYSCVSVDSLDDL